MMIMPVISSCSDDDKDNGKNPADKPLSSFEMPARNPWLAQETYSITHFNSAQTDVFPFEVEDGTFRVDIDKCQSTWSGPVNLMTLASTSKDYMWGMSSDRVSYIKVSDGDFKRVAEAPLPGIVMHTQEQLMALAGNYKSVEELSREATKILGQYPQMSMANGNYVLCDRDNYVYVNADRKLARYRLADSSDPAKGIVLDAQIDLTPHIFGAFTLVGVSMSYDGYLIVAAQGGLVSVDRSLSGVIESYKLPEGQVLTNSIAVGEDNALYLASNSTQPGGKGLMQKLMCRKGRFSDQESDGAWQSSYDGGPMAPAIKLGYGTGSTPTLMGFGDEEDHLVVITDGSKRMKLIAFWRDEIPADAAVVDEGNPRVAGVMEATCGLPDNTEWIQSEQSVVVGGYDAFVVNNINTNTEAVSDKIIGVLAIGPLLQAPKGVECMRWNTKENRWERKWCRSDVSSVSMIPSVSLPSEMVFVNGYGSEGWEVTGLDWRTGATRQRVVFGDNNRGNGAYAIIQYFPDGDLLFNSVSGPFRVDMD